MGAQGTALVDFGAFPGASDASVAVIGQGGIVSGSLVEAWLLPADTADHTADEHLAETLKVVAGNIIAGTGFTIYGLNTSQINEPVAALGLLGRFSGTGANPGSGKQDNDAGRTASVGGGIGPRIYGKWNVGWVWN